MRQRTLAAALYLAVVSICSAQTPDTGQADDQVQVDALRCWRDVRSRAVRVGEPFTMTITCGVVETDTATTVPNEVALAPETIDLSPFEVIEGQRFTDVRDGVWRFFQYEYTLRVIGEEAFGQDVELPELELSYHIERTLDGRSTLPGRELRYILPAEPIRVLSLVPEAAEDIRGPQGESFGAAEARMFRANLVTLVAAAVGIVALGCLIAAATRARRHWRGTTTPTTERPVSNGAIVRRALDELTTLQQASQEQGWSDDLASRVLTALRLAGAAALSTPVAQYRIDTGQRQRDGQLTVRQGVIQPRPTAVSSSLTPAAVGVAIDRLSANGIDDKRLGRLRDLHDALRLFTTARYGHDGEMPSDRLTSELDKGIGTVRQLRVLTLAPVQQTTRLLDAARGWWRQRWVR